LKKIVQDVLAAHPDLIEQYKAGKQNVFGFFVGACMKASKGNGNPKVFQDLLKELL
jgi:aspartyl-tRNA(Asn)/glutamyl-tRNA(Gln) amidotransferase subunit B